MKSHYARLAFAGGAAAVLLAGTAMSASAETVITLWSHWADHETKVAFVEKAAKHFEAKNPGVKVKITWYQKNPLYTALKVALSAGKAPDVFYTEVNQTEYIDNGFLLPLDDVVDWSNVDQWARDVWNFNGKTYGFPLEAQTVELYYNKDMLKDLGFELGDDLQLSQAEWTDLVKKASAKGITPLGQGVGDRPYPGHYFTYQTLLKKLGVADYGKLLAGEIKYADPRVVEHLNWVKGLIDAGMYPKSFSTIKLGESHRYFYANPGSVTLAMGSWYTSRAFNPVDKGGQPDDFPLGVMRFPAIDGAVCNTCKTAALGGCFSINAATKHPDLAGKLISEMATPEMGTLWLTSVLVQSGVRGDPSKITGKYKPYFEELTKIDSTSEYYIGLPHQATKGACGDATIQIMNNAFPAGLISVEDAVEQLDAACYKG